MKRQLLQIRTKNLQAQLEAGAKRDDFRTGLHSRKMPPSSEEKQLRYNQSNTIPAEMRQGLFSFTISVPKW